jgi:RimJ/RimL family protein N-acetyltransferase
VTKTSMTDPMDALRGLQTALDSGIVAMRPCELHSELAVLLDQPTDKPRFTYALIEKNSVVAVALFVLAEPVRGVRCFSIGYAVIEARRNEGIGSRILEQAIDELRNGLARNGAREFYLEAIVSTQNLASNRVARKLISKSPESGTDCFSGEQIFQYFRKVECVS